MPAAPPAPPPSAPQPSLLAQARAAAGDIKLAHSVFALPFAVLGAVLARRVEEPFAGPAALVIVCMVLARTWAMLVNRLADARIDARNPRTARRAIPAGRVRPERAAQLAGLCAGGFLLACVFFAILWANPWPMLLGTPVLLWLAAYSFAKRFTWWCHAMLGTALGIAPLAAALAISPVSLAQQPSLWLLALMVTLWVGGFDVIYALQDRDFDRACGLHSIPARFGIGASLWISRAAHALALAALAAAAWLEPRFGVAMGLAVAGTGVLLMVEHAILARAARAGDPRLEMQWFTVNGVISVAIGVLGVIDALA